MSEIARVVGKGVLATDGQEAGTVRPGDARGQLLSVSHP
eukprot:COSAG02_NODE_50281_length_321_cov_1.135135_1_plen_38_part_10